jgi:hypothetical protein
MNILILNVLPWRQLLYSATVKPCDLSPTFVIEMCPHFSALFCEGTSLSIGSFSELSQGLCKRLPYKLRSMSSCSTEDCCTAYCLCNAWTERILPTEMNRPSEPQHERCAPGSEYNIIYFYVEKHNHSLNHYFSYQLWYISLILSSVNYKGQCFYNNRDSSFGVALRYGLDDRGSRVRLPEGAGNFSLHHRVQNGSGAHPASYQIGTGGFFPGVKRPGRESDHSPPSTAEVKNAWSYASTPQYVVMAWCVVKHNVFIPVVRSPLEAYRIPGSVMLFLKCIFFINVKGKIDI